MSAITKTEMRLGRWLRLGAASAGCSAALVGWSLAGPQIGTAAADGVERGPAASETSSGVSRDGTRTDSGSPLPGPSVSEDRTDQQSSARRSRGTGCAPRPAACDAREVEDFLEGINRAILSLFNPPATTVPRIAGRESLINTGGPQQRRLIGIVDEIPDIEAYRVIHFDESPGVSPR